MQQILRGNRAVLEDQLARLGAAYTHFVLDLAQVEAGGTVLDDESADAAHVLIERRHGEHRVDVRHPGVGDEVLEAIEHIVIAFADRARAHSAGVRAGVGLRQRKRRQPFSAGQPRDPAALLLVGAGQQDGQRPQLLHAQEQRGGRADLGQLFDDHQDGELAGAQPTIGFGEGHRQDILLREQLFDVPRKLARRIHRGGARGDLLAGEIAHHVDQHLLFRR